ncbi:MAG: exodeoxyribonuclease VII large subunit [Oscillospiraceae bacterium]|nr:exodeoxyribonuclease VII large subunit [Oscillospiraceae bacterium]
MAVLTVSQINRYMASKVQGDMKLRHFLIKGEIANFTAHSSGHYYFTLRDAQSGVKAVMFRNMASRLPFLPENGMHVIAAAGLTVYEAGGVYQLNVTDLQPDGVGTQTLALEQRREKLRREGLFDAAAKRPLPALPKTIGVVTSGTGAALQDILQILQRRCPIVQVRVFPVLVQGAQAPASIARGLRFADTQGCDVLILGRGGGASEDLAAFNTEEVAYAVYDCHVPVISAVGHEVDVTIADAVADRRAPTPSAAAELAVPDAVHLHEQIDIARRGLTASLRRCLGERAQALTALEGRLVRCRPEYRIRVQEEALHHLTQRMQTAMQHGLGRRHQALCSMQERLQALDPLRILERGYAAVYRQDGTLVSSVSRVQPDEEITVSVADGTIRAKVVATDAV